VIGESRRLHVIGNSLGGAVALQLLALPPDRVATLVLANSAGFGSEVHPMLRLVATPVIGRLATRYPTRASARMLERSSYADRSLVTNERIDRALKFARHNDTGAVLHETARSLGTVRGDRDRILPARQITAAHRLLPHARLHLFKGVGHMPQVEAADEFAELTLDFLRSQAVVPEKVPPEGKE
jgi:pimeloyl-ACP methyl ester carboxylesterase